MEKNDFLGYYEKYHISPVKQDVHDIQKIKELLDCIQKGEEVDMEQYSNFFKAFARTLQYIGFEKVS